MKANYKDKIKPTSEVALGNLYDMNKQMMEQEPAMSEAEIELAKEHLRVWIRNNFAQKYLMLLCHDLRDYTLFNLDRTNSWKDAPLQSVFNAGNDIIECMTNRGTILSIDDQGNNSWEIWIRNPDGCFAYYLFPYGTAVLEY